MLLKIKKLHKNAIIPKYATDGAVGFDLTAVSKEVKNNGPINYVSYGTGLAFAIPEGYVGLLLPRSSISSNTSLMLSNSCGVIDADYRGEVSFRFKELSLFNNKIGEQYQIGDRVGQMLIVPVVKCDFEEVTELDDTKRGIGGYGSTGK
jgi:dUTP pyrophosphatase